MIDWVQFAQALVNGVGIGLIHGLVGIGFCVVYNARGIVNFAQGVFVTLGGMITHALLTRAGLPLPVAAVPATVGVAAVGVASQLLVVRPMHDRGATLFAIIPATLAAQVVIERVAILTVGDRPRTYPIAAIIGGFGNPTGALAGGVLLGATQAAAVVVLGAGYRSVAALVIMLMMLLFPSGIFNATRART